MTVSLHPAHRAGPIFVTSWLLGCTALTSIASAQEITTLDTITVETEAEAEGGAYVTVASSAATKTATPLSETPVTVNSVTAEQMAAQGAESVAEALRYVANVQSEYRGTSNFHDEVMIRGFSNYANKSLDGMNFGGSSNGQLDAYLLDSVEVVKGPNSLTYGQVSPGGQINQTYKTPTKDQLNSVEFAVGSNDYYRLSTDTQGDLNADGTARYRLVTSFWDKDLNGVGQNRLLVAPSFEFDLSDRTNLTLYALYQADPEAGYRNHQTLLGTLEETSAGYLYPNGFSSYAPDYDEADRLTTSLGYSVDHQFDNGWALTHKARYNTIELDHKGISGDAVTEDGSGVDLFAFDSWEKSKQFTTDSYLSGRVQTGAVAHDLVAGIDTQWIETRGTYGRAWSVGTYDFATGTVSDLSSVSTTQLYDETTTVTQTGVYVQDQMSLGKFRAVVGLRHDWAETETGDTGEEPSSTFSDEATTGRVALSYRFDNGVMPYVSYSTSFSPVTRNSGTGTAFDPETAEQFELGAKWANATESLQFAAAYFDITQDGVMEWVSGEGWSQIGQIDSKGFEFEAKGEITDRLSLVASYAKIDPVYTEGTIAGKQQQRVPLETAALWLDYDLNEAVSLSAGVRHLGGSWGDDDNTIKVPSTNLVDLGVKARLGVFSPALAGATARLSVTNLADTRYVASCANGGYCWQGEGRTWTASLSYDW